MPKPVSRRRGLVLEEKEVRSLLQRFGDFASFHWKWAAIALAGVLLTAGGYSIFSYFAHRRAQEAAAALAQLRPALANPEVSAETLKGLETISKTFASTAAALEAELSRAHLLYQTGKFEEALKAYQELAARPQVRQDEGLRRLIAESISYCQEGLGKWREAAATLKPLWEQSSGSYRGELLRRYAMLAEKAGEPEEARRAWEQLLERPPVPALVPYAKEKLGVLEAESGRASSPQP